MQKYKQTDQKYKMRLQKAIWDPYSFHTIDWDVFFGGGGLGQKAWLFLTQGGPNHDYRASLHKGGIYAYKR